MTKFYKNLSQNYIARKRPEAWTLLFSLIIALLPAKAIANDDALYGPVAPPGSAFIRIFNNHPSENLTATIGGKKLKTENTYSTSKYQYFPAGDYTLELSNISSTLKLESGHYYTAYLGISGNVATIEGRGFNQRRKALIAFYNLMEVPITLKTINGKATVIPVVDPNTAGFREVNAIKIDLSAFNEKNKIVDANTIALKRGKVFSLFASASASGNPILVWIEE